MPYRIKGPCGFPGCPERAIEGGRCEVHRRERDIERGSAAHRGYDARWRRFQKIYLAQHPLCVACAQSGRTEASYAVDHIQPHRGDQELFWDYANLQALCRSCHNAKSARERLTAS